MTALGRPCIRRSADRRSRIGTGRERSDPLKRGDAIPDALRLLREVGGRSLSEVAQVLGVAPSVVGAWERGERRIRLDQFAQLADWLEIDLGDLDDALELAGASPSRGRKPPVGESKLDPRGLARRVLDRGHGRPGGDRLESDLARLLEGLIGLTADSRRASEKAEDGEPADR